MAFWRAINKASTSSALTSWGGEAVTRLVVNELKDPCLHISRPRTSLIYCPRHSFTVAERWDPGRPQPPPDQTFPKSPARFAQHVSSWEALASKLNLRRNDSGASWVQWTFCDDYAFQELVTISPWACWTFSLPGHCPGTVPVPPASTHRTYFRVYPPCVAGTISLSSVGQSLLPPLSVLLTRIQT